MPVLDGVLEFARFRCRREGLCRFGFCKAAGLRKLRACILQAISPRTCQAFRHAAAGLLVHAYKIAALDAALPPAYKYHHPCADRCASAGFAIAAAQLAHLHAAAKHASCC